MAGIGHNASGLGGARKVLTQGILPIPPGEILSPPDAGANPDSDDSEDHDHKEDDPLVVR